MPIDIHVSTHTQTRTCTCTRKHAHMFCSRTRTSTRTGTHTCHAEATHTAEDEVRWYVFRVGCCPGIRQQGLWMGSATDHLSLVRCSSSIHLWCRWLNKAGIHLSWYHSLTLSSFSHWLLQNKANRLNLLLCDSGPMKSISTYTFH